MSKLVKEGDLYRSLVVEYSNKPRDVATVPLDRRKPKWFYVCAEDHMLYVDSGRYHADASRMKKCARMDERQLEPMLAIYHRRQNGESVSEEAKAVTFQQVYWYGIFADMEL